METIFLKSGGFFTEKGVCLNKDLSHFYADEVVFENACLVDLLKIAKENKDLFNMSFGMAGGNKNSNLEKFIECCDFEILDNQTGKELEIRLIKTSGKRGNEHESMYAVKYSLALCIKDEPDDAISQYCVQDLLNSKLSYRNNYPDEVSFGDHLTVAGFLLAVVSAKFNV